MKHIGLSMTVVVIVLMALACGSPPSENEDSRPTGTTPESNSPVPTPEVPAPTAAPTAVQADPFISAPGVANISLLTDTTGAGLKPLFVWEPVTSANRYQLVVFDEAGEPYWAWEGAKTQIYMGGTDSQPPDDSSGPSVDRGYSWAVVAYGSDDRMIAASEVRPISP